MCVYVYGKLFILYGVSFIVCADSFLHVKYLQKLFREISFEHIDTDTGSEEKYINKIRARKILTKEFSFKTNLTLDCTQSSSFYSNIFA